jgi:hypothetical protein
MYDIVTAEYEGTAFQVDLTGERGTALLGFRVVPVLQAGQTYAEAMAGLRFTYFFNSNWSGGAAGQGQTYLGNQNLIVVDGSTRVLRNALNLFIASAPIGQTYIISFLELPGEEFLPDDGAAASGEGGGGGNNPALVATTIEDVAFGYSPLPANGASIAGAKGVRLYAVVDAAYPNPIPAGAAYLCYRIPRGIGVYVRVPDLDIPLNAAAAGLLMTGFPDQHFDVGTTGEKIIWVPNAACAGVGATTASLIIEVQS